MNIFERIKWLIDPPSGGMPISGKEDVIHLKRKDSKQGDSKDLYFHFPGHEYDFFVLEESYNEFTKAYSIKGKSIMSFGSDDVLTFGENEELFRIGFQVNDGELIQTISTLRKQIPLGIGDSIEFLHSNGHISKSIISTKPIRLEKDYEGIIIRTTFSVTLDEIWSCQSNPYKKWHYSNSKSGQRITGIFDERANLRISMLSKMLHNVLENE